MMFKNGKWIGVPDDKGKWVAKRSRWNEALPAEELAESLRDQGIEARARYIPPKSPGKWAVEVWTADLKSK